MTHSVCVICGHKPEYGPTVLCDEANCQDIAIAMAAEIGPLESTESGEMLSQHTVEELIHSALKLSHTDSGLGSFFKTEWARWQYFETAVAIGYFGPSRNVQEHNWTDGRNIKVRRVRRLEDDDARGPFDAVVIADPLAEDGERKIRRYTACQGIWENPNFFALEGPIRYLQEWIDWDSLPGRELGFPHDPAPMSFEGEFYEIVNTQRDRRGGVLPPESGVLLICAS